ARNTRRRTVNLNYLGGKRRRADRDLIHADVGVLSIVLDVDARARWRSIAAAGPDRIVVDVRADAAADPHSLGDGRRAENADMVAMQFGEGHRLARPIEIDDRAVDGPGAMRLLDVVVGELWQTPARHEKRATIGVDVAIVHMEKSGIAGCVRFVDLDAGASAPDCRTDDRFVQDNAVARLG